MKKTLSLLLILSSSIFAKEITLDEAIQMAMSNSKEIKISEKDMTKSKIAYNKAIKEALPTLDYTGSYNKSEYERSVLEYQKPSDRKDSRSVSDAKESYTQQLVLTQPLFTGGAISSGIKYAKATRNISDLQYMATQRDVRLDTIKIYSSIVENEKNLKALKSSEEGLKANYDRQKRQLELDLITKSDLLKTEYTLLDVQSQIIGINNLINTQKDSLKIKIGMDLKEEISVVEFDVPKNLSENIDFNKDKEKAKNESINAKISEYNYNLAQANSGLARAEFMPKVNAFVSYGNAGERTKYDRTYEDAEFRGGVSVSWNLFSFGQSIDGYKIAKLDEEQQELSNQLTKDGIDISITSAYLELLRVEKEVESKERALETAEENYKIDSNKYEAGLISTIDFLAAETQLREAKVGYNKVVAEYLYAYENYRSKLL